MTPNIIANADTSQALELVSYKLCPYVQRAVITLTEKSVPFVRTDIDLSHKPKWFIEKSPTGKVPMLVVNEHDVLFESHIICEYIDNVTQGNMLPSVPLARAQHQGWIAFGSTILNTIAKLYSTPVKTEFEQACRELKNAFRRIETEVKQPYFSGDAFMMVDAVYAPIFRYFDVFESNVASDATLVGVLNGLENTRRWRQQLEQRPSVQSAVAADYSDSLLAFVAKKGGYLSHQLSGKN